MSTNTKGFLGAESPALYAFDASDPGYRPARMVLADQIGMASARVNLNVAEDDDMFLYSVTVCPNRQLAIMAYFRAGLQITDILWQLAEWHFGDLSRIGSYLDFACGQGRATRFSHLLVPREKVWVSEILTTAVTFQTREFGYHAVPSATNPDEFRIGEKFDVIFVCSLFTHLPESTFTRWLARLYSLLAPGGLLVFTIHDEVLRSPEEKLNERGFYFGAASEVRGLDPETYGYCFANERFVRNAIHEATGREQYGRIPRGMGFHQDIYLVANAPGVDYSGLRLDRGPNGCLDTCVLQADGRTLKMTGWAAAMTPGSPVERVGVYLNGICLTTGRPDHARPDVAKYLHEPDNPQYLFSGWTCMAILPRDIDPAKDILLVKAITVSQKQFVLDCRFLGQVMTS